MAIVLVLAFVGELALSHDEEAAKCWALVLCMPKKAAVFALLAIGPCPGLSQIFFRLLGGGTRILRMTISLTVEALYIHVGRGQVELHILGSLLVKLLHMRIGRGTIEFYIVRSLLVMLLHIPIVKIELYVAGNLLVILLHLLLQKAHVAHCGEQLAVQVRLLVVRVRL